MWKNREMMQRGREERNIRSAVCATLALCASLFLMACTESNYVAGQTGQGSSAKKIGVETAAEENGREASAIQSEQEADWLAQRTRQDRRTKHDLRTEPEDLEKIEKVDLDACENGKVVLSGSEIWLSGSLEGQVVVDTEEDELVHLYLAGVQIASPNGPALWVQEAAKVVVTLVSETENILADSPDYTDYEETPACLYSACDLTINGGGALQVFGYHEDGIRSKDRMKFLDGTISVQAKGDGIRGNDGIYMQDVSVAVESEKNGLRTVNQGVDDRGVIEMNGGMLSVVAGKKGICAASNLYLYRGQCSINAVEEKVRAEGMAYIAE